MSRATLLLGILLFLSAAPDTMAAVVLKELFVDRYGVPSSVAPVFMAVNLLGALASIPLLLWARRRMEAVRLVALGSVLDAALLLLLAAPIGFWPSIAVRTLEGVSDVVVFAGLFDIVRRVSRGHAARGLGYAGTPLMLGLALGAVIGGQAAHMGEGTPGGAAGAVFGASAASSLLVASLVWLLRAHGGIPGEPASDADSVPRGTFDDRPRPLMWSCAMTFTDRATGGLITGTLPLILADVLHYVPAQRGWIIGLPLLLMALCTGPAGALCDRIGSLRMRLTAGIAYAAALAAIPLVGGEQAWLAAAMIVIGVAGSVLFASSLALAAESGGGAVAMGAYRASGDLGFFAGTVLSVALLASIGGRQPAFADYALVLVLFAGGHLAVTVAVAALAWRRGALS